VRPERFELPTYSSGGCRSIQLSYGRTADLPSVHRASEPLNGLSSAAADLPKSFILIIERQQPVTRVVALATVRAGNEAADVHPAAVVILGHGKTGAATAWDKEHAGFHLSRRLILRCAKLRAKLHDCSSGKACVVTGLCPVQPTAVVISLRPLPSTSFACSTARLSCADAETSA
jgi:hypothetical protein